MELTIQKSLLHVSEKENYPWVTNAIKLTGISRQASTKLRSKQEWMEEARYMQAGYIFRHFIG